MKAPLSRPWRLRRPRPLVGFAILGSLAGGGWAQSQAAVAPHVYGLTEEQKAQVRDAQSGTPADALLFDEGGEGSDRGVHGELGAMIGTGGARAAFGTAAIPLGQNGGAIVSFETSHFGSRPYR